MRRNMSGGWWWRGMVAWLMAVLWIGMCGLPLRAEPAQPVFQPDGSIKSTKATVSMNDSGLIEIVDGSGVTHGLHLSMNYRNSNNTCGAWFTAGHTTQKVKSFDSQTRTTSFYGVIVPPTGSYDTTPIPFCYWMHLKDDGKIRVGVEFYTSTPILQPLYAVDMKDHARPRSSFVGHYMVADTNSYLLSTSDPIGTRILYSGSIQTTTFLSDVPDQMIRMHKVDSGGERIVDFNIATNPYFEVRYSMVAGMANRMQYDVQLPDESPAIVSATPVFQADGRIVSGQTSLTMSNAGEIQMIDSLGITYGIHMSMVFRANGSWFCCGTSSAVTDRLKTVDMVNKKVIFTGNIQPPAGSLDMTPIPLSFWMQLQSNGKVRIQADFSRTGSIFDILSSCDLKSHSRPRSGYSSHTIQADNDSFVIANEPPSGTAATVLKNGTIQEVRLLTDSPLQMIVMRKVVSTSEGLRDYNVTNTAPYVEVRYTADGTQNRATIDVTFPPVNTNPSSETYGGVDFWASDTLRMPSFGKSVNLISNPSFEHDLLYWRWNTWGSATASSVDRHYLIDTTTSYQGGRSLKIVGKQGQQVVQLATFATPVESGQTYTLSFYAKTDSASVGKLWLTGDTALWGTWIAGLPSNLALTTSWQRYSYTFTAPNGVASIGFALNNPSADCNAWIDAVQLEKASSATPFVQRSVVMSLQTDHWGNLYQPGETPTASVRLTGTSGTSGTLNVYVCDLNGNETKKQTNGFTIGSSGETTISQTWTTGLAQGVYVARLEATVGGNTYRDFGRIAVMPSVSLSQPGRQLFAMHGGANVRYAEWNRQLAHYTKIGIGSAIYFDPAPASLYPLLSQYQMTQFSSIFEGGENVASLGIALRTDYDLTATERANLQTYAYNKALANPQITCWKLMNEPDTTHTDATRMGQMIAALQAAATGIKQANPNAMVMTNDPSNMNPSSGINYINSFLQYGGGAFCDILAIHPYRYKPETPDVDSDCATLMQVLQTRNFTGDVWFTEGIYHQNYVLPVYGLNTHVGCSSDSYRGGPFTYDMGWGERMCAAYTARSWLAAMKYGNRVKLYVDWGIAANTILDYTLTPTASVFSVNTLVRTLGGAVYQGQPVINASIRSYVFTDSNGYQVAPVWYYSYETDMGQSVPGTLNVANLLSQYGASNIELVDFTGNVTSLPASVTLEPWPIFIRAKTGTAGQFITALNQTIFNQDYTP